MDYNKLKSLIEKLNEVERVLSVINAFIVNMPKDQMFLALFTEKEHGIKQESSTMMSPFGQLPVMLNVPQMRYEGGFEVKIKESTSLRISQMLVDDLNKQKEELERKINDMMTLKT